MFYCGISEFLGWLPIGVASQKTGLTLAKLCTSPPSIPQHYEGTRSISIEPISRKLEETHHQNVGSSLRVQSVQKAEPSSPTPPAILWFL
jgi:hypothetical protein